MGTIVSKYITEIETKDVVSVQRLEATAIFPPDNIVVSDDFIEGWGNNQNDLIWDVTFKWKGLLNVAVGISNYKDHANAEIEIEINGSMLKLGIPSKDYYQNCSTVHAGSLIIKKVGFSSIYVRAKEEQKGAVGRLYFLELTGPAIKDFQQHTFKGEILPANDAFLQWNTSYNKVLMFYNEMQVTSECVDALFVAIGFFRGYLGFEKGIIVFSINNPGLTSRLAESRLPDHYKVTAVRQNDSAEIMYAEKHMKGVCSYGYTWKTGEIYRFIVLAKISKQENRTYYSAYFYLNDTKMWIHLATFKGQQLPRSFAEFHSSIEDCRSFHGYNNYRAIFGPALKYVDGKGWSQLLRTEFLFGQSSDSPIDVSAYVTPNNKFVLSTGQSIVKSIPKGGKLICQKLKSLPECLGNFNLEFELKF